MPDLFHSDDVDGAGGKKQKTCSLATRRSSHSRPFLVSAICQTAALICGIIYSWRHFGKMLCLYVSVSGLSTVWEEKARAVTVSADQSVESSCASASAGFVMDFLSRVRSHVSLQQQSKQHSLSWLGLLVVYGVRQ